MYVCMYACMIQTSVCVLRMCVFICTYNIYIYIYIYIYTHTHIYMHACRHTQTRNPCVYLYGCVCVFSNILYIYILTYTKHIHTDIHAHIHMHMHTRLYIKHTNILTSIIYRICEDIEHPVRVYEERPDERMLASYYKSSQVMGFPFQVQFGVCVCVCVHALTWAAIRCLICSSVDVLSVARVVCVNVCIYIICLSSGMAPSGFEV